MKKLSFLLFISASITAFGQGNNVIVNPAAIPHRGCGTMEALAEQLQSDPRAKDIMNQIEAQTAAFVSNNNNKDLRAVINIPVVFHVVYNGAAENVPDAVVLDQLRILNEDLRKMNSDTGKVPAVWKTVAADCQVNLCLAQRDPSGNPTTGITRTSTTITSFSTDNKVKYTAQGGRDVWDRNKYLNIWICDLGSSLLGYGQFPGGSAATDGVVIHYKYTGSGGATYPYDKGRTLTHELGHWLNLYHIWGDDGTACSGSDQVTDTPNQGAEHYGCYTPGSVQTDGCATTAPGTMWQNFMDYTDDACMYMFTNGQKARIQALFGAGGFRQALTTSLGCTPVANLDASIVEILNPSGGNCNLSFSPVVTLKNKGVSTLTAVTINYNIDGGTNAVYSWTGSLATGASENVTLPSITTTAGNHTFNAFTSAPNAGTDQLAANDAWAKSFTILASATPLTLPLTEGFQGATFPPTGWTVINPNGNNTWTKATVGGFGTSNASAKMDNFTGAINIVGQTDDLITPAISLANANSSLKLKFNRAYAKYSDAYFDSLLIEVSSNCGNTWSRVYSNGGTALETKVAQTTSYTATAATWKADSVSLAAYAGLSDVRIRFRNLSGSGNNLFLDDINLFYTSAGAPVANFTTSAFTLCAGQTSTFTDASTNNPTSWSWSFPGGTPSTSTAQNPTVTYSTAGVYNVTLTATNSGGSNAITKTSNITVNAIPGKPTVTGSSSVCEGASINLAASNVTGANYSWTGPNSYTNSTQNVTLTPSTTAMSGTYSVTATVNGCTSAAGTKTVTVNIVPVAPTAGSNGPVCDGSALSLTSNTIAGATYNWTGPNTFTSSSEDPSVSANATTAMSGTYSVTVTVNGCTSVAGTSIVTVNPSVSPAISTTNNSSGAVCAGTNVIFTASDTNGGTSPSFQWQLNGVNAGTNSNTYSNSSLTDGDIVTCILTSNALCANPVTATSAGITMTVTPTPSTPVISQSGNTLTSSSPTGNQWYLNGVAIPGETNQTYTFTANGDYTVVVTSGGCSSGVSSTNTVVNVGIGSSIMNQNDLLIYPNPSNGKFTLSFLSNEKTNYKIEISNVLGQIVYTENVSNLSGTYSKQLSVEDHGTGVYTITLKNNEDQSVKKLVVY